MGNDEKKTRYAIYKTKLKKAISNEFYLEAIFIEYAMIEDRIESAIRHAGGIKLVDNKGKSLMLSRKINKICACKPFTDTQIRKKLPLEFLNEIIEWKQKRDAFIHSLMNQSEDIETLRSIAEDGLYLVKILDSKVKSVNRIFDKNKNIDM